MCRLYGMRASHPTQVDCALHVAQNALIRQSQEDARGLVNDHGWGLGYVHEGEIGLEREVGPAAESAGYRRDAAKVSATTALAHVRRATVGQASLENTHPFRHGRSLLVHNGHIGAFDRVREELMAGMEPVHREAVTGTTDTEHFFHFLLSRRARAPDRPPEAVLRDAVRDVSEMVAAADPGAEAALNVLWAVDGELVGSRLGRSLWYLERDRPHGGFVCGDLHPDPAIFEEEDYRAAVVASERITGEDWREVPEATVFRVGADHRLRFEPLGREEAA